MDTELGEPSLHDQPFAILREAILGRTATVGVVGLGYVGLPLLIAAAAEGFPVMGIDTDPARVRSLDEGRSYVGDVSDGQIHSVANARFGTDPAMLADADVIIVAVPTPLKDAVPDLGMVKGAGRGVPPPRGPPRRAWGPCCGLRALRRAAPSPSPIPRSGSIRGAPGA